MYYRPHQQFKTVDIYITISWVKVRKVRTLYVRSNSFTLGEETGSWGFPPDCMCGTMPGVGVQQDYVSASATHFKGVSSHCPMCRSIQVASWFLLKIVVLM